MTEKERVKNIQSLQKIPGVTSEFIQASINDGSSLGETMVKIGKDEKLNKLWSSTKGLTQREIEMAAKISKNMKAYR